MFSPFSVRISLLFRPCFIFLALASAQSTSNWGPSTITALSSTQTSGIPSSSTALDNGVPLATIGTDVIEDVSRIIVVASVTLSAGGPAVTDDGKVVVLGYSDLSIGSTIIELPESLQYTSPSAATTVTSDTSSQSNSSTSGATSVLSTSTGTISAGATITSLTALQPTSLTTSWLTTSGSAAGLPSAITVTDAAGSTIVGTPTIVTNPTSLSTTTLSNPAWTGNTFTTTSTQGGGPTVVPILLVGGVYIGLFGLGAEIGADASLLSVFALAGLPAFSLLPDGEPQLEPETDQPDQPSEQASQDQPSQTQTSQTQPPPQQSTQLTSSQTSISSQQSSQLTSSQTSISSATISDCSACDACSTYDYSPIATPNPLDVDDDDGDGSKKRGLAGRFYVEERAASKAIKATVVAKCPVSTYTRKPDYPGPGSVANNEGANNAQFAAFFATATYWAVPTNPPNCNDPPAWAFLDTNAIGNFPQNQGGPWALGGNKGKSVNIDHVYEVSLVDDFFAAQVAGGFTCADIATLFDVTDGATGGTRLNSVFGQLASYTNPDFLGMDSALNGLKGSYWNAGLQGAPKSPANANGYKQALANLAVVMSMANNAKIASLFETTNARIYQAFLGIDNVIKVDCGNMKDHNGRPFSTTWANAYSTWITDKIASQNQLITATAAAMLAAIPTVQAQNGNQYPAKVIAQQSSFVSNFNTAFQVNALTFPAPGSWPKSALPIQKRQACALSQSSTNPTVSAMTSASQSTNTGSQMVTSATPGITAIPTASTSASSTSTSITSSSSIPSDQTSPAVSSPTSSTFSATVSTLLGPTTFCEGLSPGGGNYCLTVAAGCYAISPTYNYVPQTTCTGASLTSAATSTALVSSTISSSMSSPSTSLIPPPTTSATPTTSTVPPTASRLLVIYAELIALDDGEGTTDDSWFAVDFNITGSPAPGSINACDADSGQELPNLNEYGHWDDLPASWVLASPIATSLTSCTFTVSETPAASSATGSLTCPGLPTPVACPPVVSATVGSCLGGSTFSLPGLPGVDFGGTVDTPEALAYCEW